MKVTLPQPFTFEGDNGRAVLLLHGFTGNSADVRMMGRFLQKRGYTCHAPQYQGHGVPPEELVKSGPDDWWQDVVNGYEKLKEMGFEEVAVAGLSLGGVFSLKIGYTLPVKGIIPMCAPVKIDTEKLTAGVKEYAKGFKEWEKKTKEQIQEEMATFEQLPLEETINSLEDLVKNVRENIDMIYTPTFVVQGRHDEMIGTESADIIHEQIETDEKQIKLYEESGHVITLDKEKEQLHQDVYAFLEQLDWKE
ncbi:alpha/beta hydrolase [Texcoconibacillus texcoconensis]|uniref:Carboxylesterase n=1 Tax=Texcoconibacillus texcoconensis TaxID=1095777 RepID=A0A840QPX2_9BACI|nr:carboxylesterase [Texcoconibacillus texcoconensis]MBB5173466.1 carboxylesterase [Texcoconibacillus texcoconensis]